MNTQKLEKIIQSFEIDGNVVSMAPLGDGLINDTFMVKTADGHPDYVLQRVNHSIFQDVDGLQANIEAVTSHIRRKLVDAGTVDIDRKVLTFVPNKVDGKTYIRDDEGNYWRMSRFIEGSHTLSEVNPETARLTGRAFGNFEAMLTDLDAPMIEPIPRFHDMEFRAAQLREALDADPVGRLDTVRDIAQLLLDRAPYYCRAEEMHRRGELPKRICHCDTKVSNMLFDDSGDVLCVIDLDTVMPSFVFSDYGDFLRTAANTAPEDEPDLDKISFDKAVYEAFTEGYLESARSFLTPVEIDNLPFAVALFPYMQAVRFFADYINGDTYYKTAYPDHNLVRTRAQIRLLECVESALGIKAV